MRRWALVRLGLKVAGAASLAAAPFAGGGTWSAILAAVAAGSTALSVDLPRDRWTPDELAARQRRRRSITRSNPLTPPQQEP